MAAKFKKLMPIGDLRDEDLLRYPMWCFASGVESEEDQDETSVEPVEGMCVPLRSDPIFVATRFVASDGSNHLGLVLVSTDSETAIEPCAIVTSETYAPLPDSRDLMTESTLRFTEKELQRSRHSLYPLAYTLCVLIAKEGVVRSGQFSLPTAADA